MRILSIASAIVSTVLLGSDVSLAASSCEALEGLTLSGGTITHAEIVEAGQFRPPGTPSSDQFNTLPAFCRALVTLTPSRDSDVRGEVWMPVAGWNGKLQVVGNGGLRGSIVYLWLSDAVASGYAAVGTDGGHRGNNADFAQQHEKLIDFAYRAVHEATVKSKLIVAAHYDRAPTRSYYRGCSTGGRQGLMAAQRYPEDFDGIVAGAPAWDQMRLYAARVMLNLVVNKDRDSVIPPEKYRVMHDAVMAACDWRDGVEDGVIEGPMLCRFNYASLQCAEEDRADCLTRGQVESARAMTSPVTDPESGRILLDGHLWPGSELQWSHLGGPEPCAECLEVMRKLVFRDGAWDYHTMTASDVDRAVRADDGLLQASDSNLSPYFDRGGKLLMYHGWSDPMVTPQMSTMYYDSVINEVGSTAEDSMVLFMVPGMSHCRGGPGPDRFDAVAALDRWVEEGQSPERMLPVTDGRIDRTRPLCPYPRWVVQHLDDEVLRWSRPA